MAVPAVDLNQILNNLPQMGDLAMTPPETPSLEFLGLKKASVEAVAGSDVGFSFLPPWLSSALANVQIFGMSGNYALTYGVCGLFVLYVFSIWMRPSAKHIEKKEHKEEKKACRHNFMMVWIIKILLWLLYHSITLATRILSWLHNIYMSMEHYVEVEPMTEPEVIRPVPLLEEAAPAVVSLSAGAPAAGGILKTKKSIISGATLASSTTVASKHVTFLSGRKIFPEAEKPFSMKKPKSLCETKS
jgi:hypothetical protein